EYDRQASGAGAEVRTHLTGHRVVHHLHRPVAVRAAGAAVDVGVEHDEVGLADESARDELRGLEGPDAGGDAGELADEVGVADDLDRVRGRAGLVVDREGAESRIVAPALPAALAVQLAVGRIRVDVVLPATTE